MLIPFSRVAKAVMFKPKGVGLDANSAKIIDLKSTWFPVTNSTF